MPCRALLILMKHGLTSAGQVGDRNIVALEVRERPEPREGDVVIRLVAAALNHRDEWMRMGLYPGIVVWPPFLRNGRSHVGSCNGYHSLTRLLARTEPASSLPSGPASTRTSSAKGC